MRRVRIGTLNKIEVHSSISDDSFKVEKEDMAADKETYWISCAQKKNPYENSFSYINKKDIFINKEDINNHDYFAIHN